ncbi:MAG: formate dehydrogenase accessory sulfurtransferase FdhD, partial [Alphaproteobacteria bacterium]
MSANPQNKPVPGAVATNPAADGTLVTSSGARRAARWRIADEAPLALLYNGEQFGVMMVTPHDLEDFALGFTLAEGIARSMRDIEDIRIEQGGRGYFANVKLASAITENARERRRSILAGSACGICGAQTIEAAIPRPPRVYGAWPDMASVAAALAGLAAAQPLYRQDRSTHAAAFANADGDIVLAREDIGRHNALDKLAGAMVRDRVNPQAGFVVLSSRLSVEMVIKAARIGVPFVASVSAPSRLALDKAGEA